jgi:serine/threonine protein phosphatase PrpC
LQVASLSDIGLRRGNNQDSLAVVTASSRETWEKRGHLFIVADGMGAHAAGELASKLATDIIPLAYQKLSERAPPEALVAAMRDANAQIHARGTANEEFRGMGTTVSSLALLPQGALVAHVGDSRVYRLRATKLEQLTFDHSLVWELQAASQLSESEVPSCIPKNIITRSLGPNSDVQVDLEGPFPCLPGDTFLLCSDGLSGQVKDDEIGKTLLVLPPEEAVRALVDLSNLRGGPDNTTIIIVRLTGPQTLGEPSAPAAPPEPTRSFRPPIHPAVWSTMGLCALATGGLLAVGQTLGAGIALLGAIVAGVVALLQRYGGQTPSPFDGRLLGRGPHRSAECGPDAEFVRELTRVVHQVCDAASGSRWKLDWTPLRRHVAEAEEAAAKSDWPASTAGYCRAVMAMMAELRRQGERITSPNGDASR